MTLADLIRSHRPGDQPIQRPFVIAEAGVNHEGSMEIAKRLIHEAAQAGADAIKFQTYKADTIAVRKSPAYWDLAKEPTTSQHELFSKYDTFWKEEFEQLRVLCEAAGIEFMSTPFDVESATFLNDLMGTYKVASADLTNLPFIRHICSFGKPVLLSTGASDLWEITEAVGTIKGAGNPLALMHCVLNYPTDRTSANLGMIVDLRQRFPEAMIGYSDHTTPDPEMTVLTIAVLLGARVLEKHFTHDKTLPGNDHYHAMNKDELVSFRTRMDDVFSIVGSFEKHAMPSEAPARLHARRSLVAARAIKRGALIGPDDLTWKRPAHGISPREYDDVIGRTARQDIAEDEILEWAMLE
jgi:N-acetylneuraminate synthase